MAKGNNAVYRVTDVIGPAPTRGKTRRATPSRRPRSRCATCASRRSPSSTSRSRTARSPSSAPGSRSRSSTTR